MREDQVPEGEKQCTQCGNSYPAKNYSKWYNNGNVYYKNVCNTCRSRSFRSTPHGKAKTKEVSQAFKARYRTGRLSLKLRLMEFIGQTACRCGASDPRAIHFHHRDPSTKSFDIKYGFTHKYSFERLAAEAMKCDVLCANCHSRQHRTHATPAARRKATIAAEIKLTILRAIDRVQCSICPENDPVVLAIVGRDQSGKPVRMSSAINRSVSFTAPREIEPLIAIARSCQVFCLNCNGARQSTL